MNEVLEAVTTTPSLAGVMVVTVDAHATALAKRLGARVVTDGARDGHTGSVTAGLKLLASEGRGAMLTLPADIPAVTSQEISLVVGAHLPGPSFTISPAHDHLGSNTVICSPPDAVPLRFGDNSYYPHLDAARRCNIEPTVIHQPGIAMDIDHPADLAMFLALPQSIGTRTRRSGGDGRAEVVGQSSSPDRGREARSWRFRDSPRCHLSADARRP